jgi:oligopeptide/dipeptide ABC transporter ATP-binding protein
MLLSVSDLRIHFDTLGGTVRAVDGVDFSVDRGETLGMVGESGCGKSVSAMSLLRLIPAPPGRYAGGRAIFEDRDLLDLPLDEMRDIRGNRISMIFQEPMTSLNPVFTVGEQIAESLRIHKKLEKRAAREQAREMLAIVGIPEPKRRLTEYPHQLSGGMRQRVMIAMALSCRPALLIADEPTTALDVTVQAQILDLMRDLQTEIDMGIIMITHDLGVIAETADRVVVMYCGRVVETADVHTLFNAPGHPYTRRLMQSVPRLKQPGSGHVRLQEIPGIVPSLFEAPSACIFHPRCAEAAETCRRKKPRLVEAAPGHWVACGVETNAWEET